MPKFLIEASSTLDGVADLPENEAAAQRSVDYRPPGG